MQSAFVPNNPGEQEKFNANFQISDTEKPSIYLPFQEAALGGEGLGKPKPLL